ncbi:MAG: hypothetical protein ACRELX_03185 [Longimicrobiales bacterium]
MRKTRTPTPEMAELSGEEQRSLTHGEFWIPEGERVVYQEVIRTLNEAGLPFVVSGLYAIYEYTGIYRKTKDLDLFFEPRDVVPAAKLLKDAGFTVKLEQAHWIAKALKKGVQTDLIYGMGNGLAFIDADWYRYSRSGILAALPVRVAPPEDLIWHRLFVYERHRADMADVLHLILSRGDQLDWDRLLCRVGDQHWPLLLAQIHLFDFVYPGHRGHVPRRVRQLLLDRARDAIDDVGDPAVCLGTLISRFSFSIDVNEWGFRDLRKESTVAMRQLPIVQEIVHSDVWD